jgi:hypothetical protein
LFGSRLKAYRGLPRFRGPSRAPSSRGLLVLGSGRNFEGDGRRFLERCLLFTWYESLFSVGIRVKVWEERFFVATQSANMASSRKSSPVTLGVLGM